jgi:hypothetical protein
MSMTCRTRAVLPIIHAPWVKAFANGRLEADLHETGQIKHSGHDPCHRENRNDEHREQTLLASVLGRCAS